MKIFLYILLGIIISIAFLMLGEVGLILLAGATFGLLLYIAVQLRNRNARDH
ncbi:hypothetical protein LCM20_18040 [Halobacillus litoralis]|uniref:hypothetical protein n=1 Tax=Halobacillus litoralis TaxID=45668 RepID=UPI001CD71476|nr:hypothetical protein [Halobacillus litoralis]MCA0972501.1 hypothetical protein [Halobacillus litoralis]